MRQVTIPKPLGLVPANFPNRLALRSVCLLAGTALLRASLSERSWRRRGQDHPGQLSQKCSRVSCLYSAAIVYLHPSVPAAKQEAPAATIAQGNVGQVPRS